MDASEIPFQISDYHVLPINLPPVPAFPPSAIHCLYLKPHEPKSPHPTAHRSLFLVNVPFDATEPHLRHLFSAQLSLPPGRVSRVDFESKPDLVAPSASAIAGSEPLPPTPPTSGKKAASKKRKHASDTEALPEVKGDFPPTWDRELRRPGGTAVVEFVDRASMNAALRAAKMTCRARPPAITWEEGLDTADIPPLGLGRYLKHAEMTYPDRDDLLSSINTFMTSYNAREEALERLRTHKRQEPDAEGFVTVSRGTKGGSAARQEEVQRQLEKQKEKQKGFDDFYRFQGREKRKEREMELRRQFAEDRGRVQKMQERKGRYKVCLHVCVPALFGRDH